MGQPGAVALFADGPLGPCRMGRASPGDRAPGLPAADLPAGVDRCRNALAGGDEEVGGFYPRPTGVRPFPRPVNLGAGSFFRRRAFRPRGLASSSPPLTPAPPPNFP